MKRRWLCVVLAVVMCLSASMVAMAEEIQPRGNAGIYGSLYGTLTQSGNKVVATTAVARNPDSADLWIFVDMNSVDNVTLHRFSGSQDGGTTYSETLPIPITPEFVTEKAYSTHEVRGSESYVDYNVLTID